MTDDQRKKYEEAAKAHMIRPSGHSTFTRIRFDSFIAGCTFASQDTEERVRQAHNEAIDKALAIVNDAYTFDREDKIFAIEDEIQKLKL